MQDRSCERARTRDYPGGNLPEGTFFHPCLLYTSDAADERSSVDLGGRRIIKKKKKEDKAGKVITISTQYTEQ